MIGICINIYAYLRVGSQHDPELYVQKRYKLDQWVFKLINFTGLSILISLLKFNWFG